MTKKQVVIDLIIIFLLGLVVLLWYPGKGFFVCGHDVGYPLHPQNFLKDLFFVWTERIGFGVERPSGPPAIIIHSIEFLFSLLSGSIFWGQKLTFIFWFILPGALMYLLVHSIATFRKYRFMALMAGIFYMFNHFQLQGWGVAWRTRFSVYALLPLALFIMKQFTDKKRRILQSAFFLALSFFFLNGGGGFGLSLYGGLIISLGAFLIYFTVVEWQKIGARALKRSFLLVSLALFLFIIFNFYWLLPFIRFTLANYSKTLAASGGPSGVLPWIAVISKDASFLNLFRLQGFSSWYDNLKHPYSNFFLKNPILIFLSFLWPLFAFAGILLAKKKERKYVFFFGLLVLVAMVFAAGTHPPSGKLYEALVKYIPFFPIFRTPFYKFGYPIWFGYAFLISFTASKLLGKFKKKWISGFLSSVFIIFVFLYSHSFFTGSFFNWNLPLTMMVKIPAYVFRFGEWVDSLDKSERVLMLPSLNKSWGADAYDWNYWSLSTLPSFLSRKPVVTNSSNLGEREKLLVDLLYDAFWERNEGLTKKLISILNIKYFLLRKDAFYDLEWCLTTSPDEWQNRVESLNWVKPQQEFGEWIIYELEANEFLPHFYVPKKFTYVQGNTNILADVIGFKDSEVKREMYFAENAGEGFSEAGEPDSVFVAGQCVRCNPLEGTIIKLPLIWFLPDSIFYPLIEWKEARWEKKIRALNDPAQIIDLDLGLASKRLAELDKLVNEGKSEEKTEETMGEIIKKYQARIEDISYLISVIEEEDKDINEIVLRISDYFEKYKKVLTEIRLRRFTKKIQLRLENVAWYLDDFLTRLKGKRWSNEEGVRKYTFDIPQEGEYELFVKSEEVEDYFIQNPLSSIAFELDGKLASRSGKLQDNGWISVDKIEIGEGKHKLAIILPEAKNLIENENLLLEQERGERSKLFLPINNLDDDGVYQISFEYKVLGERRAEFMVTQDTDEKDEELDRFRHKIEIDLPRYGLPRTFKIFFKPEFGVKQATLEFFVEAGENEKSILEVEKIRVERVWSPKVILRMVNSGIRKGWITRKIPKITFRKINPTRYEVGVKEAKEPYTLVFSESFHEEWKAWIADSPVGEIGNRDDEAIMASYFDGEIKEETQQDNFWPKSTFENWNGKSISEDRHILANNYANSWYITPTDSDGRESYKLIIEFWPQRFFYIGIAISALSFVGCLAYLAWFSGGRKKP